MAAPHDPKIVITGTGRSGTTLLVQILTDLGFDTGFSSEAPIDEATHAGLETRLDSPNAPRIVKNPNLSRRLDEILTAGTATVEHVIIPMRDLDVAAASRVRATRYGSNLHVVGGLFGTTNAARQREAQIDELLVVGVAAARAGHAQDGLGDELAMLVEGRVHAGDVGRIPGRDPAPDHMQQLGPHGLSGGPM